jgi:CheY-like chemotaxis protein
MKKLSSRSTAWRSIKDNKVFLVKVFLSFTALALAVFRLLYFEAMSQKIDNIFLILLVAAILIFVVPWDRLQSFKAGDVEFTLDQPQVKGALKSIEMKRLENKQLRKMLSDLEADINHVRGSRILWIDDKPHEILGERRLLRALGIEIITAKGSKNAKDKLEEDNDFDLIITDAQRAENFNDKETIYGGIYFIKQLRTEFTNDFFKEIPVIFYSAYKAEAKKRMMDQDNVVREVFSTHKVVGTIEELLNEVIETLSKVRSNPVMVKSKKEPTSPY